jgi:TolB protein
MRVAATSMQSQDATRGAQRDQSRLDLSFLRRGGLAGAASVGWLVLSVVSCVNGATRPADAPVRLPQGEVIAFANYPTGGGGTAPPGGIFVMSDDGSGAVRVVALEPIGPLGCPSWSPDGSRIVFDQVGPGPPNEVWVVNSDGTGLRRLGEGIEPSWSPDGTKIAFAYTNSGNLVVQLPGPQGIYVMDPDGGAPRLLVPSPMKNGQLGRLAWSPDGSRIAFSAQVDLGEWALFVADTDGTGLREVPHTHANAVGSPTWSPDGQSIAFTLNRSSFVVGLGSLYVAHLKESEPSRPARLGPTGQVANPSWSPDGARIAFDRANRIWVIGVDATGATRLAGAPRGVHAGKVDYCPAWSPVPMDGS